MSENKGKHNDIRDSFTESQKSEIERVQDGFHESLMSFYADAPDIESVLEDFDVRAKKSEALMAVLMGETHPDHAVCIKHTIAEAREKLSQAWQAAHPVKFEGENI